MTPARVRRSGLYPRMQEPLHTVAVPIEPLAISGAVVANAPGSQRAHGEGPAGGPPAAATLRAPGARAARLASDDRPLREVPRNHLELQLAAIWAEMLKLPEVGAREDFFHLGGDSLIATEMIHRVELECGCRVEVGRVLNGLTVERLAIEILAGSRASRAAPVVLLQEGEGRTPFFFLHIDYDGGGFFVRRLARALGSDVTMYAVQPLGANGTPMPASIESIAAAHVHSIRQARPSGPYFIGGFCGGGVIAYEVARQLVAQGEEVRNLLLVDAAPPNLCWRSDWERIRRLGAMWLSPEFQRALFLRLKWYREDLRASGRIGVAAWFDLLWHKLKSAATSAAAPGAASDAGPGEDRSSPFIAFQQRTSFYVPAAFPGRVTLFRTGYLDRRASSITAGWDELAAGVEVHHVDGDHFTCITTHAQALAARMRPYLQH